MASLVTTIRETLRYRGAIGQWSWVLHRLTGLGVVLFLTLHVIDTSWAVFWPEGYEKAIAIYQSPLFTIGEFGLVFAVVYHALNGLRIVIFDYKPEWWKHQQRAAYAVLAGTAIILVPVFIGMFGHVIEHYRHDPFIMPLTDVIWEQRIFAGLFLAGAVAAFAASFIAGQFGIGEDAGGPVVSSKHNGSQIEKFWWSFMRISGVLIIPVVFGHLAFMHVLQGVFDLTAAGSTVVGTGMINESGTATEFVMHRWGVTGIRIYDGILLILVTLHGFNGLRYVLTDYTMEYPLARRAMTYLTIMGAVGILLVGLAALLGTIEPTHVEMASEALRALRAE